MHEGTPDTPKFISPPNKLKAKVGHGGIPPEVLKKGQIFIEKNQVNFGPYALEFVEEIKTLMQEYKSNTEIGNHRAYINRLAEPIMGLKSNGGMFQYPLVSMISDVVLQFIDRVGLIDNEVLEIINAHNLSISTIIASQLKGYAGESGNAIIEELIDACERYYRKHNVQ